MKKIIAAAMLIGASALGFADDAPAPTLKLNGYFNTGYVTQSNFQDAAVSGLWGDDAGATGGRFNLDGKFDAGDYGVFFELRTENWYGTYVTTATASNNSTAKDATTTANLRLDPYLKSGYVFANFLNKMIYAQAGIVNDQALRTPGASDWRACYAKEVPGVVVDVKPVDGLVIQGFALTPLASSVGVVSSSGQVQDQAYGFGLGYTLPGAFKANVQSKIQYAHFRAIEASVGLLAVPNLSLWVETEAAPMAGTALQTNGLEEFSNSGKVLINETVDYGFNDLGVEALHVGLVAYQFIYGNNLQDTDKGSLNPSLKFTPWVSYAIDKNMTAKLGATYFSGAEVLNASGDKAFTNDLTLGNSYGALKSGKYNNAALFEIKPQFTYAFNSSAKIVAYDAVDFSVGSDDISFGTSQTVNKVKVYPDAKSFNTFGLDFVYNF